MEHPILKIPYESKDGGEQWKDYVVPNDLTTQQLKNNDYFIFERRGQPKGKKESESYWYNKKIPAGKTLVDNYNVIFKQGVHPVFPIPCCGKKPMKDKYKIGDHVNVQSGKKTLRGEINKILKGDKYEVIIDSKIKSYHVSKLKKIAKKEEKNTLGIKTKLVSKDVFRNPNNKG